MNKEKLIEIIQSDIDELKEIAEEIRMDIPFAYLEVEIAISKAKLLAQELQLLKEKYLPVPIQEEESFAEEIEDAEIPAEPVFEKVIPAQHEPEPEPEPEETWEEPEPEIPEMIGLIELEDEPVEEELEEETEETEETEIAEVTEETELEEEELEEELEEDEQDEEEDYEDELDDEEEKEDEDDSYDDEEEPEPEKRTVGEHFHHEKSLNESLGSGGSDDHKIGDAPIGSLQASISINDRFLFIREVFDNNAAKYNETIRQLDSMTDIKEAVEYLSKNFKIKKTETSLKFVEFIKRRFSK